MQAAKEDNIIDNANTGAKSIIIWDEAMLTPAIILSAVETNFNPVLDKLTEDNLLKGNLKQVLFFPKQQSQYALYCFLILIRVHNNQYMMDIVNSE